MMVSVSWLLVLFHWPTSSLTCSGCSRHKRGDTCHLTHICIHSHTYILTYVGIEVREVSLFKDGAKEENEDRSPGLCHFHETLSDSGYYPACAICLPLAPPIRPPTFFYHALCPRKLTCVDLINGLPCLPDSAWVQARREPAEVWRTMGEYLFPQLSLPLGPDEGNSCYQEALST